MPETLSWNTTAALQYSYDLPYQYTCDTFTFWLIAYSEDAESFLHTCVLNQIPAIAIEWTNAHYGLA